ncbi:hypothetical protein IH992_18530 [Candidatus Poribacteria bacterium]|nr:hypothetical protein [Candidatus Poribacteria bacterium]
MTPKEVLEVLGNPDHTTQGDIFVEWKCDLLYRWVAGIRGCDSTKATSGGQKAKAHHQSYRTI